MTMKNTILILALSLGATSLSAQESAPAAPMNGAVQQPAPREEVLAVAGQLKEALGNVHNYLGSMEKYIGVAEAGKKESLAGLQSELMASKTGLEAALTEVSRPEQPDWTRTKADAEAAISKAHDLLARTKKETTTAVN